MNTDGSDCRGGKIRLKVLRTRTAVLGIVLTAMFLLVLSRFYRLQIAEGELYRAAFEESVTRQQVIPGSRGRIYDRNGNVLADNEPAYKITIADTGRYEGQDARNQTLNGILDRLIQIIEEHGDSVIQDFPISWGDDETLIYTEEGSRRLRFLADVFGHAQVEDLSYNERLGFEEGQATPEQVLAYLRSPNRYDVGAEFSEDRALKIVSLRYAMGENNYRRYVPTDAARQISEETMAAVLEQRAELPGVEVVMETLRQYEDSEYFAHILGYTGQISEEEFRDAQTQGEDYSLNDMIGKTGIERSMESELRGRDGRTVFHVDHVGRVTEELEETDPSAGRDIYLTIDADLQKAVYHLLEQKLAGILLANMVPVETEDSELQLSTEDVIMALLENHIVDTSLFAQQEEGSLQHRLFSAFVERRDSFAAQMETQLAVNRSDLSASMQEAQNLAIVFLQENGIMEEADEETGSLWKEGAISLEEFLRRGISEGWMFPGGTPGEYVLAEDELRRAEQMLIQELPETEDFQFFIYRQLLREGVLSNEEICMALIQQGAVAEGEGELERLRTGGLSAYAFLRDKIRNLELTPAQLALFPSTASCVVTDPATGEILACVTYPGYDNNRLANQVDGAYYRRLLEDRSLPLYNRATQERTAPGSTFKPITAAAGLTEGIIDGETLIEDLGIFEEIIPSPRCWIYPAGPHGSITVTEALRDSCNYFFYTLGYEMSLMGEEYQPQLGVQTLRKYAGMFGLNEQSGIEIPENSPHPANEFPVTAAIGQSNHSYTTTQLARYVSILANRGGSSRLTLIRRTAGPGETEKEESRSLEEISEDTWDRISQGMRQMAENNRTLREVPLSIAGKTGTAQQNRSQPNHALFIGYAPAEAPQIAIAVRIANGYSSGNAVDVSADIFRYYFHLEPEDQLITGQADIPAAGGNVRAD